MSRWKKVPGHEGYEVSDEGVIRNRWGHTMRTQWRSTRKCYTVNLAMPGGGFTTRTVGSLVLEAFLGCPNHWDNRKIGYKDGDHGNLRLDNLYFILEPEKKSELPKVLNDEGTLLLWKAICHQVIEDLYYGMHPRRNADKINAESAQRFLKRDMWYYLGDEPDQRAINHVYEKARNWTPHKIIRTSLTKAQPEAAGGYKPPEWKKRCAKCKYSSFDRDGITPAVRDLHIICNYIIVTGQKRPCRGENCTVFKEKR